MIRLLVTCAVDRGEPMRRCTGQSRFLGEAGLALATRGVEIVCAEPGDEIGFRPVPGAWEPADAQDIDAVYDRSHPVDRGPQRAFEERGIPVVNATKFADICDDKLAFAASVGAQGVPVPETVHAVDPTWREWDLAYAKPRRGSQGRGVRVVGPDEPLDGGVVQRGVRPVIPGQSLRVLLQRAPDGRWTVAGIMDRRGGDDADVVSLTHGAAARPAGPDTERALAPLIEATTAVLDARPDAIRVAEVGVDVVVGPDGPVVLEWNARPGRSFDRMGRPDLRAAAVLRPFEWLLGLVEG